MSETAGPHIDVPLKTKTSDLPVRTVSAVGMLAVAAGALWLGGWFWTAFVALIAVGVLWEWRGLVLGFAQPQVAKALWLIGGLVYVGLAAAMLISLRGGMDIGLKTLLIVVLGVIGTDVGAYFAGRTIGGPKIAPSISPSKTWAGLLGGIVGAGAMVLVVSWAWASGLCDALYPPEVDPSGRWFVFDGPCSWAGLPPHDVLLEQVAIYGVMIAVAAQTGDFFESWMKRRAGLKDSGKLIPGHGGLFDRVDGLLAVCFVLGAIELTGGLFL